MEDRMKNYLAYIQITEYNIGINSEYRRVLYGIFNDKTGSGVVGDLPSAGGSPLRSRPNSRDSQGGKDLATAAGCEETSRSKI